MFLLLCVIVLVLYFIYYIIFSRNYDYWSKRNIPFEEPFFIFGNFYNIATRKEHIFETSCRIYNNFKNHPYVGIFALNNPMLIIRDLGLIKKVLIKDFDKFCDRPNASNEKVDPIAYHTLFSAKGQTWRSLRSKITPIFTSGKLKLMFPLLKECGENLTKCLQTYSGTSTNINYVTKRYAIDTIASCAFGIDGNCLLDENSEIHKMAIQLFDTTSFIRNFSLISFFFIPKFVDIFRLTFVEKQASDYFMNVFTKNLEDREIRKIKRNDLIDLLNGLKKEETIGDDYIFDDTKMAAQAISFFSAGNDTTANAIAFVLYELAMNPECQEKVRNEVTETFEKANDEITYEDINQGMKYLDMVVRETLRKYPLASFLNRKCISDYSLDETGATVEKGTSVIIPISGLHYDPDFFPNPNKFDPERFNDENKSSIIPYTYMPFGDGPRACIGQRFAVLATKVGVAYAVKNTIFEKCKETTPFKINPQPLFLQKLGGIILRPVHI